MYRPVAFVEDQLDVIVSMVESASLGHVVVAGPDGLDAAPIPLLVDCVDDAVRLRGHVARANPLWRAAPCPVLVIVPLADAYVSPSWYPSKTEHGRVVPTWNYEVVHLHGTLVAHDDGPWVEQLVRELTGRHESGLPTPWSVDDAPPEYVERQLRAIVGIEVEVSRIEAKRKLSQNRSADDQRGVVAGLQSRSGPGPQAVAEAMRRSLT